MQPAPMRRPPKLNLLALPSLPGYLFAIMAVVITGALLTTSLPGSPLSHAPSLTAIFLVLVIRDFLIQPERQARAHGLRPPQADQHRDLRRNIAVLAERAGLRRAPELRLADTPGALFALGTLRHGYLAVGTDLVAVLESDLLRGGADRRRAEAALLHEMEHLRQGDIILVGLARSLLRVGTAFGVCGLLLLTGVAALAFAFPVAPVFDPAFARQLGEVLPGFDPRLMPSLTPELAERMARPPDLGLALQFLLNAFLPLIITVGLMFLVLWPRLLRVREFYADAGVATQQGSERFLWSALGYYGARIRLAGRRVRKRLEPVFGLLASGVATLARQWLRFHPTLDQRGDCLSRPAIAFGDARANGLLAGLLSLLLDLLLVSAFSVFYATQVPGAIPVIVGILVASFTLLPSAVEDNTPPARVRRSAAWIIGQVLAWRMGFHLLSLIALWLGTIFVPSLTAEILTIFVHVIAGVLIPTSAGVVSVDELVPLAAKSTVFWAYLAVLIGLTLCGGIALEWRLRRQVLTWYGIPSGIRGLRRLLIGITVWTACLTAGLWLPLITLVAPYTPTAVYSAAGWTTLAIIGLVVVAGAALFRAGHRRYAGRCRTCDSAVPGHFSLGRQCPNCNEALWPELVANY